MRSGFIHKNTHRIFTVLSIDESDNGLEYTAVEYDPDRVSTYPLSVSLSESIFTVINEKYVKDVVANVYDLILQHYPVEE